MSSSAEVAASELRVALREVLRHLDATARPLDRFHPLQGRSSTEARFAVQFDDRPPRQMIGLKMTVQRLRLPDERILGTVLALVQGVWHLKDYLKRWAVATGQRVNIETEASRHQELMLVADLANRRKHGENRNRSDLDPRVNLVEFCLGKNGVVELSYDGASKDKALWVSVAHPIPWRVLVTQGPEGRVVGDAVVIATLALRRWIELMHDIGVLDGDDPETEYLRAELVKWSHDGPS
jgi:hypothetical protein